MAVSGITVTVYCDGAFHEPEKLRFHDRVLKNDIRDKLKSMGWVMKPNGSTYCPQHQRRGGAQR